MYSDGDSSRSVYHRTSMQSQIIRDKSYSLLPSFKMRSLWNLHLVSDLLISAFLSQCTKRTILFWSLGKAHNLFILCFLVHPKCVFWLDQILRQSVIFSLDLFVSSPELGIWMINFVPMLALLAYSACQLICFSLPSLCVSIYSNEMHQSYFDDFPISCAFVAGDLQDQPCWVIMLEVCLTSWSYFLFCSSHEILLLKNGNFNICFIPFFIAIWLQTTSSFVFAPLFTLQSLYSIFSWIISPAFAPSLANFL